MKKLIALLLSLALLLSVPAAFGDEYSGWDAGTMQSTVSMTIDSSVDSFVIVIPASMEVDPLTKTGTMTVTLKAGWELICRNSLALRLSGSQNGMKLVSEDLSTDYTLTYSSPDASGTWNGNLQGLFMVRKGGDNSSDTTATLTITVDSLPGAGVFTDVLTFSIN